jgi:hypothetical protein
MYTPLDQQYCVSQSVQGTVHEVLHAYLVKMCIVGPRHGSQAMCLELIVVTTPISHKLSQHVASVISECQYKGQ